MEMKTSKLNKTQTKILKDFANDFTLCFTNEERAYCYLEVKKIYINLNDFLYPTHRSLFDLLHEIGHSVTWNDFSKKAWKNYYKTAPYEHNIEKYFIIPQERVATDWAYNYIKNHPNKVKKLEAKLQKKLEKKGYTLYE